MVPHHYVTPNQLRRHLSALVRFGFRTIRLSDFMIQESPEKPIVLTFDDGYENFANSAVPIFQALGQTATVFAVSGLTGKCNEWDTKQGDVTEPLMTADQLRSVRDLGFEVGSHSVSHARLTTLDQNELKAEVERSKADLEDLLGVEVTTFCYPYGAQNEAVRKAVESATYRYACSVEKGWNDQTTDPFRLRRTNVRSNTSTPILFWKLWRQSRLV